MSRTLATLLIFASTAGAASLAGCTSTTHSGTAYTVTFTRHVDAFLGHDHEKVYNTALETLSETFMYDIEEDRLDGRTGYIKGKTAKGNLVTFSVTRESKAMSEVSIFVGPAVAKAGCAAFGPD